MREIDTSRLGPIRLNPDPPFTRLGKQVKHMGYHFCDAVDEISAELIVTVMNRNEVLRSRPVQSAFAA